MKTVAIIFFFLSGGFSKADSPAVERPQIFVSEHFKSVLFCMTPGVSTYDRDLKAVIVLKEPSGVAYKLEDDGSLKVLYRTKGWYSNKVFVSMDAQYLVRIGPWNEGRIPSKEHVAVEFYKDGKIIKGYSTRDLVKDARRVRASVSHYEWRGKTCKLEDDRRFMLDTIDGIRYVFDVPTGDIVSATKIEGEQVTDGKTPEAPQSPH